MGFAKGKSWWVSAGVAGGAAAAWIGLAIACFPRVSGSHAQDLSLYRRAAQRVLAGQIPYRDFGIEYPPLALLPITLPEWVLGRGAPTARYALAFLLLNAVWSVALGACIWAAARRWVSAERSLAAAGMYALLAFVGAPLFPWRFDLFPTLLSALSLVLVMKGRPAAAGISLGAGVAAKLYPIVFLPIFVAWYLARGERGRALRFMVCTFAATTLICAPFVWAARADFLSFLRYHQLRGLQIESASAGLLMLGHTLGVGGVSIVENFGAIHLLSPTSAGVIRWLLPAFVAGWSAVAFLAFSRFRNERSSGRAASDQTLAGYALVALLVFMLTNKVLSPQYVIWLLPFIALLPAPEYALGLAATVLTIVIFPYGYDRLLRMEMPVVLLLNARNLLWAVLAATILWRLRPRHGCR
ncbi:MAG TPA: glycosyltransferase 87 family protein [Gemmatimonadaceae bacterium]|nr:glycosyltransferase 87 family protein [Gemmatimonadaceae bacterium]